MKPEAQSSDTYVLVVMGAPDNASLTALRSSVLRKAEAIVGKPPVRAIPANFPQANKPAGRPNVAPTPK